MPRPSTALGVRTDDQWTFRVKVAMKNFNRCKKSIQITVNKDTFAFLARTLPNPPSYHMSSVHGVSS
jgi:hypothetical protein